MKQKIKSLLADPAAMLAAAILMGVVAFVAGVGLWIKANIT